MSDCLNIVSAPFVGEQSANTGLLVSIVSAPVFLINIFFALFLLHEA